MSRLRAANNTFHFNKIVNATESGILNVKGDPGTVVGNTFENNKLINSKVSPTTSSNTTSATIAVDNDDNDNESEKEKGKKKK